jgi:hypothetical protein
LTRPNPDTVLVTGIHREELAFGDRVAELLQDDDIDVLRIPHGIPQKTHGTDAVFYATTRHREIYLQLRQQVKARYRLLIDLHCGIDDGGHCADVFCHDPGLRECLECQARSDPSMTRVRVIGIVAGDETPSSAADGPRVTAAHTWIPRKVWQDSRCTYVGLEIYLPDGHHGDEDDWRFACSLVRAIQACQQQRS